MFCKYGISAARNRIGLRWFSVLNWWNIFGGNSEYDEHFRIKKKKYLGTLGIKFKYFGYVS